MAGARVSPILAVTCSGTGAAVPASPQPAFSAAPARRLRQLSEAKVDEQVDGFRPLLIYFDDLAFTWGCPGVRICP